MAHYRCLFLDASGTVICIDDVNAETDRQALEKVRRRIAAMHDRTAFELWSGSVRIHAEAPARN